MRRADWINLIALLVPSICAWIRPLPKRRRIQATTIGAAGLCLILVVRLSHDAFAAELSSVLSDWLPAPLMLLVYWQTGRFLGMPDGNLQSRLEGIDRRLLGRLLERQWPHWLADYLELAYLLCYPLVPIGVVVLYLLRLRPLIDEYWTVVLPGSYVCYLATAFSQTLPPRMLPAAREFRVHPSKPRRFNLWILGHASIGANTFPSAHVAASMGASLVIISHDLPVGLVFLWLSCSIAAGAVLGRYHYLADALAGATVAAAVFLLSRHVPW